jgi:hypothetical protein
MLGCHGSKAIFHVQAVQGWTPSTFTTCIRACSSANAKVSSAQGTDLCKFPFWVVVLPSDFAIHSAGIGLFTLHAIMPYVCSGFLRNFEHLIMDSSTAVYRV